MSNPELIKASVKFNNGLSPRIVWSKDEDDFLPYVLDFNLIQDCAAKVREALYKFVNNCMKNGAQNRYAELKEIAKRGNNLYQALFYVLPGQGSEGDPEEVKAWLQGLNGEYRIHFSIDKLIHIPWGLIYDTDPDGLPNLDGAGEFETYKNFWNLKYRVSSIYLGIHPLKEPKAADSFKLVSVFNQETYEKAKQFLQSESELKVSSWLMQRYGSPIFTSKDLFDTWKTNGNDIDMLFLYCHANGTTLSLSDNDTLDISTIKLRLKRGSGINLSPCMVFLNGCHTAVGSDGGGFLEVTGSKGFCGFLGTETVIPDVFALRFAMGFFHYFFTGGLTVYQVMERLRKEHWPLSLVYSTYCHPQLQVKTVKNDGRPVIKFSNFSQSQLGTSDDATV